MLNAQIFIAVQPAVVTAGLKIASAKHAGTQQSVETSHANESFDGVTFVHHTTLATYSTSGTKSSDFHWPAQLRDVLPRNLEQSTSFATSPRTVTEHLQAPTIDSAFQHA